MTTLTATQTATLASPGVVAARPRVLTWPLVRLLVTDFGAMTGFYLLLSAVPLYATSIGAGGIGACLSTGVLMLASVAAELITPRLAGRFGYRRALLGGLILLGAPALLLPLCSTVLAIMAVSVVRGIGFAVVVVTIGALGATVVPAERRGEGLGVLGVVSSVPAIVALPLGVWLVPLIGYPLVFAAGAAAALAGVAAVVGYPGASRTRRCRSASQPVCGPPHWPARRRCSRRRRWPAASWSASYRWRSGRSRAAWRWWRCWCRRRPRR